jgi:two-component system, OmpR family, phosphate regulon sensor histidine kinase PhoR
MNPLRSVSAKLSLLVSLCVLSVIGLMARRLIDMTRQGLVNEMRLRALDMTDNVRIALVDRSRFNDPFQLAAQAAKFRDQKGVVFVAIVDSADVVVAHSSITLISTKLRGPEPEKIRTTREAIVYKRPSTRGMSYELWQPVWDKGKDEKTGRFEDIRRGSIVLSFDDSTIEDAIAGVKREIALIAAVATVAAILGTLIIVGWITRPLPLLAAAARQIASGNFKVSVKWRSRDEVGMLARAFNEMAAANAVMFEAIRQEKERIERIFNNTREGMVLASAAGEILVVNPAAARLLGQQEPKTLQEAFAAFKLEPPLEEIMGEQHRVASTCDIRREQPKLLILSCRVERLGETNQPAGFLFLFYDATIEKREEILERNFLSLVSHKLRTPLAVSLGNLELVRMEKGTLTAFQDKALGKIHHENEKLRSLVEKLIMFTTVQSPDTLVLDKKAVDLDYAVAAAMKALGENVTPAHGVTVAYDPAALKALSPVLADERLLVEIFKNLIENAAKFNPKKEKKVEITAAAQGEMIRVAVKDDGPGIASEDVAKLFRKFFQVDPDFTGQIPGFGLGLAFVKDVIKAHGGESGVKSAPGQGSEFYFSLQKTVAPPPGAKPELQLPPGIPPFLPKK